MVFGVAHRLRNREESKDSSPNLCRSFPAGLTAFSCISSVALSTAIKDSSCVPPSYRLGSDVTVQCAAMLRQYLRRSNMRSRCLVQDAIDDEVVELVGGSARLEAERPYGDRKWYSSSLRLPGHASTSSANTKANREISMARLANHVNSQKFALPVTKCCASTTSATEDSPPKLCCRTHCRTGLRHGSGRASPENAPSFCPFVGNSRSMCRGSKGNGPSCIHGPPAGDE
ncbi:hypothetical protein CERZMDRAFT_115944 [Cercospora zeae-maydis SCOH1-5]|uniref:Uncharacterized protein n=1 Tax=Cercospora zeae-maydis SCOH1-5 TaxID=717836 RepID=A0A6A6FVB8_9PEZI|nr:hypothetical protein CERZMDRAFT_115944 [Cercospora zeae-maydis SCOH1-5]